MIVDVHTHLPTHPGPVPESDVRTETAMRSGEVVRLTNSPNDYLAAISSVDRAFIFGVAERPWDPSVKFNDVSAWGGGRNANDVAAAVAAMAPGRVVPFMTLHPLAPGVHDEYDRAAGLGCKGIKLAPNFQVFEPMGDEALRLYGRLESDGVPVLFHAGTGPMADAPLDFAEPRAFDRIAIAFPRLKMILAHLGHPWHTDCIAVVRKHPNVYADISAQIYRPWSFWNGLRLFLEWGCLEKIFFGSDWPVATPQETIHGIREMPKFARDHHLPGLPEAGLEAIIQRDAAAILEIA